MAISNSNEYGFALACDEHVFFLEYIDAIFCEDLDCAIIGRLAHTHQRSREVLECVCLHCLSRELSELLVPPLVTPTFRVDVRRMGRPALRQSFLLM
jgi:hypothetical protein